MQFRVTIVQGNFSRIAIPKGLLISRGQPMNSTSN